MQQYLLVSFIYEDKLAPIAPLIKIIAEHHGIIKASRLLTSGDKQSLQLQIKGSWNEIVKLENMLTKTAKKWGCQLILDRANKVTPPKKKVAYAVELFSPENTNALYEINQFFLKQGIVVYDMSISPYYANPLGNIMSNIKISIFVPENYPLPELRENFVELCDSLNLDAYLEPIHA